MNPSSRIVLIGLRLSSLGLWAVAASVVLLLSLSVLQEVTVSRLNYDPTLVSTITLLSARNLGYTGLGVCAVGLLLGFVGRCFCLGVSAAVAGAPARIRLAVIFEACSLLSVAALVGLLLLLSRPLPSVVPITWTLFCGVTAYLARMKFLQFTRTLAEYIAPRHLVPEAGAVQRLFLYVPCGFLLAFGVVSVGQILWSKHPDDTGKAGVVVFSWLICTAATLFAVFTVWRWAGLLTSLRAAVALAAKHEEEVGDDTDPDAEYRRRYHEAQAATA